LPVLNLSSSKEKHISLQARLDRIRESFQKEAPPAVLEVFRRVTEGYGDDSRTLPIPARYIIDTDGIIRYARSDPDYTHRPEPEETIEALRRIVDPV